MKSILVLGGTGTTGRRIARRLSADNLPVRTASRTGGDVCFDRDDPTTWGPALDGAGAMYLLEPALRPGADRHRIPRLVSEAVAAGVTRLVLLSAYGVGEADDGHPLKSAEQAVCGSGVDWTILQPDWFAQNFSESFWLPGVRSGTLAAPTGDGRTPFVDAEDIAAVAAAALTEDRHRGRSYRLTGPAALSFGEALDVIAAATGRTLRHLDVPAAAFADRLTGEGVPAAAAELLTGLLVDVREGRGATVSDGVQQALGRPPRSFEQFVDEAAAAGRWA
ncbi:NmrA family transcriptional regulator [Kitasatospora griseola]|uniref:NmrA family transcriptional regulator n=1 Tax=Kitasatospora griseola TaxID=2064 RepID=A0A0D0Q120_KITGR|nr:NAD(P)H-binding protein [Kitasatospora griseola]KIQ66187.1 NmrA family transcriptional regulator [Kitasatospora griseola]